MNHNNNLKQSIKISPCKKRFPRNKRVRGLISKNTIYSSPPSPSYEEIVKKVLAKSKYKKYLCTKDDLIEQANKLADDYRKKGFERRKMLNK